MQRERISLLSRRWLRGRRSRAGCQRRERPIAIRRSRSEQTEKVHLMQAAVATLCDASVAVITASPLPTRKRRMLLLLGSPINRTPG